MRFRHKMTGKNTMKRVFSFLLMLCLLVPMLPSSIGLEAKADDTTDTTTGDGNTVTITLHDLYIDRKEALPDGTNLVDLESKEQNKEVTQDKACLLAYKYARSITVTKGTTLEQAFEQFKNDENLQLGTSSLKDTGVYKSDDIADENAMTSDAKASTCVWYTRGVDNESHSGGIDGNNSREKFNSNTAITEDIDLYTYSYRLRLITGKQEYKDLIVREGQSEGFIYGSEEGRNKTYKISDFLNTNNVDNQWTDINTDTAADTSALTGGLTRNYILRANGVEARTQEIDCKVAVNGSWVSVGQIPLDLDRVDVWGRTGPALNYYVTDTELKNIYGKYGFGTDVNFTNEITKEKNGYFPYSNGTGKNLYIRQMPKYEEVNGATQFRVPLIEDTTSINDGGLAIYYTPHNTTEYDSNFLSYEGNRQNGRNRYGWASPTDSAVLKENSFYTVSVDADNKDQFNSSDLPKEDEYHLYGSNFEFTLPLKDKDGTAVKWYVEKGGDNVTITENGDTATVTVKAIDKQLVLTTDASKEYADDVQVHCFVLVNGEPKEIGKLHTHATQKYDDWGSGENQTRYYVTAEQAESVFGEYGFDASKFKPDTDDSQKYIFANTTYGKNTSNNIWTDAVPAKFNDVYKIPLAKSTEFDGVSGSKDLSLYYVPKNTQKTTKEGIAVTADTLKTSTFYSISTDVGETNFSNLPKTKYVLNGTSTTIDLPSKDDSGNAVTWYPEKGSDILTIAKKDDNTVTVSITNIDKEVVLTTDANKQDADAIKVHCYILVDGQPVEVGLVTTNKSQDGWTDTKETRYYVTAKQVETVFNKYGFTASEFNPDSNADQKYIFANAISKTVDQWNNPAKIWADVAAQDLDKDGNVKIALVNKSNGDNKNGNYKNVDLYYVPNNRVAQGYGIDDLTGTDNNGKNFSITKDTTFLRKNSFYSINVEDPDGLLGKDVALPTITKKYYLSGESVSFKLPYKENVAWTCHNTTDGLAIRNKFSNHNGDYIPITIESISNSITYTTQTITNDVTVHCYIFVNKEKLEVATVSFSKDSYTASGRYYITASNLGSIYSNYGFDVASYQPDDTKAAEDPQNLYFPTAVHENSNQWDEYNNPDTLWADAYPHDYKDNQGYKIPLTKTSSKQYNIDLYYVPKNNSGYLGQARFKDNTISAGAIFIGMHNNEKYREVNTAFIEANTFYSITAKDEAKQFSGVTLPDTQYALTGTDKTITLPYKEGVNWYIESDGSTKKITPDEGSIADGEAKYTFSKVSSSIKLTTDGLADDEVAVSGYISVNGKWKKVSSTLQKINTTQVDSGRYHLTSDDLEKLFGSYGFKAEEYKDTDAAELSKYFPSSTIGAETISTNAGGKKKDDGSWWVNTIEVSEENRVAGIAVYYVPNIANIGTGTSFSKTNEKVLADNQFYVISFEDSTGLANVPSTMYLRGGQVTIKVPYANSVTWTVLGTAPLKNNDAALYVKQKVSDNGDSAELTFNLHSNVTVTTKTVTDRNEIGLEAYVSLNGTWTLVENTGITGISRANWNGTNYYITEQELLDIYQAYGFTGLAEDEYHIAVTTLYSDKSSKLDKNGNVQASRMWADQTLTTDAAGNRFLPLIKSDFDNICTDNDGDMGKANVIRLYYVPNNTEATSSSGVLTADNADPAKRNAFYTITFDDKNSDFPDMDKTEKLLLSGKSTELTLPYQDGVTWIVTDKDGSLIRLDQTVNNETVTIQIPAINQPLIVTTGTATSETLAPGQIAVNAYIAIDDAWVSVGTAWKYTDNKFVGDANSFTVADTQTTEYTTKDSKGEETVQTRYYLTVDQLQNIFGTYGFEASSFTDGNHQNIFPHTTINFPAADIYADIPTKQIDGKWCVLFTNKATDGGKGISIYYTPTRSDGRSFWGPNNTNLLRENSVRYTVSAKDRLGVLPSDTSITYPEAVQVERSGSATYKLPSLPAGYHWTAVNKNTGKPLTKAKVEQSTGNSLEYTISDILEPVQFIVWKDGEKRLTYDARVTPEKLTDTSTFAQPEKQEIVIDGSIEKKATKSISFNTRFDRNTTILSTDSERAQVTLTESSHPRTFYYTFQGWQVDGTDTILKPGDSLSTLENYDNYELISLTAVWKAVDENSRPATVNFYVSLDCEIMDNTGDGVNPQNKENFTESVYATRIYGTNKMDKQNHWEDNKNSMFSITASDDPKTAYGVDSTLRKLTDVAINTKPEQGKDGKAVPLKLESFPTDEEVLANLRDTAGWNKEKQIKLDGKTIDKDDLTTDNFAVRWYVLKYQSADAWHIDGVLVAKEAHVVVTKTFAGNAAAIKAVKEKYSISVTHERPQEAIDEIEGLSETDEADKTDAQIIDTDYTLVLKPNDTSVEDEKERGYDSYDPATDTYTWILTGRQGRAYRVKENYYLAPTDKDSSNNLLYNGTYRYMIKNCTLEGITNDVWQAYEGETAETGIELVAEAYPTDVPSSAYQTIAFENRYVSAGDLTIQKIDSATQNGLKNVNFTLSRLNEDGTENPDFVLWRTGKTSEYAVELPQADASGDKDNDDMAKNLEDQDYMVMANKVIMTDQTGYIYIRLPTGKYKLTEEIPLGYKGALTITIDVDANGKISTVSDGDKNLWAGSSEDGKLLTIKNESRLLTTVTALKQWNANTHTDDQKPVIVELWRNGAKMSGSQYTQTLSATNNWQFEWENLPLFIDGAVAKYELRETYIGNTAYDAGADEDGYADYNVSYETAKYCDGNERPETENKLVDTSGFTQSKATWQNDENTETHYATHALLVVNNSLAKGYISFQKMDGLNRALPGAEFKLYTDQSCSTAVATATSQEDGTVQFASQRAGTYYMKETKAPDGYAIDPTVYTVTVSDTGTVRITKPSDSKDDNSTDTVMRITNVSDRTLTLRKVSSTSGIQPLAGATFTIKRDDAELGTFTTGSDGTTNFDGLRLDDGHYTITETQAPSGYTKLIDHIDLIVEDGKVSLGQHGKEAELTNSGNSYTLTVKNALESNGVLPSTGNFNPSAALAALLGAALMCGASALALWLRKKRGQNTL